MGEEELRFDGRVAVVTGAGRGLGRQYVIDLARRGATVVLNDLPPRNDHDERAAHAVAQELRARGGRCVVSERDISETTEATALVADALDAFGRIDVVINNAGAIASGNFGPEFLATFKAVVDSHLLGSAAVTAAAWPHLRAQGYGRVVMTGSSLGYWGSPTGSAYAAAKAGIHGLTKALALEGEPDGIRVNCIAPAAQTRHTQDRFGGHISRRWRPAVVSAAALYLAHESCQVTGRTIAAFAGHYATIEAVQGVGYTADARAEIEPEDLLPHLDQIFDLTNARPFRDGHVHALSEPLEQHAFEREDPA